MAEFILMPKLGFNMESGQLVKWHKREGESVLKGEALFEVLTDKTNMVVESTVSGVVRKRLAEEGDNVPVFLPIAIVGDVNEDIGPMLKEAAARLGGMDGAPEAGESTPGPEGTAWGEQAAVSGVGKLLLSPRARKYLAEHNVDITGLTPPGTGFQGGITAADVADHQQRQRIRVSPLAEKVAARQSLDLGVIKGTGAAGRIMKADVLAVASAPADTRRAPAGSPDEIAVLRTISYSGIRKIIGDRLSHSMFTAPHLYFTTSVDVTKLLALRRDINGAQEQKVSLNDLMAAAVVKALQKHPELNSSLQGDKIIQYADVNLGIAVGIESGLIVPVLRQAQLLRLTQFAQESKALVDKAHKGKLMPDEYKGGTFTISNLGMYGIENFTAIINPPEVGILSISAARKTPVVIEDGGADRIEIRSLMHITLSVDHRVIDGLVATRFINHIKSLVEEPVRIVI